MVVDIFLLTALLSPAAGLQSRQTASCAKCVPYIFYELNFKTSAVAVPDFPRLYGYTGFLKKG